MMVIRILLSRLVANFVMVAILVRVVVDSNWLLFSIIVVVMLVGVGIRNIG